ncbi:hypothetical protein AB1N83_010993 [Pleurotus pulmonarius]
MVELCSEQNQFQLQIWTLEHHIRHTSFDQAKSSSNARPLHQAGSNRGRYPGVPWTRGMPTSCVIDSRPKNVLAYVFDYFLQEIRIANRQAGYIHPIVYKPCISKGTLLVLLPKGESSVQRKPYLDDLFSLSESAHLQDICLLSFRVVNG